MARRQFAAHAQPALHARRAAGRAARRLSRRGVLAGPAEGHRRRDRRGARAARDPRIRRRCRPWMRRHGVRFQPSLSGALHLARTNAFFMGGGKALVNAYYRSAEALGVDMRYDTPGRPARPRRRPLRRGASPRAASASRRAACVLACGGFESNREWLREAWGQNERGEWPADNFLIRGTRFNQGVLLQLHARCRRRHHRRPDAGALRRHRRARAALRRRHLHAHRLRLARRRRQPRCAALLRRGRGLLAEALCDLGPSRRAAAGPDRLLDHRRKAIGRFMPPVFAGTRPRRCPSSRASWA